MKPRGVLYFLPAILYMGLIFYLSSRPAPPLAREWPTWWGIKSIHVVEYAVLAGLLWCGFARGTVARPWVIALASVAVTFLWGISDEIHQAFVPERTALAMDAVSDLVGGLAGIALCAVLGALRRRSGRD